MTPGARMCGKWGMVEAVRAPRRRGTTSVRNDVSDNSVVLRYGDSEYSYPVVDSTVGDKGFDIGKLRNQTGLVTLDSGYGNTAAYKSAITYLDGEQGILRYRGYPIEQLAERSTFVEVAYLLIHGELPTV